MTKSQQAIALAMMYPELKGFGGKPFQNRLSQARLVLRHSPELARAVLSGAKSINTALAEITKR